FVQGKVERAAAFLEAILPQVRSNLSIYISRVGSTLGSTYLLTGRTAEALPLLEEAAAHDRSIGFLHGHSLVLALLARGYLRAGRLDDADRTAGEALALARKLGERGWEAWTHYVLGELAAEKTGDAAGHYRAALALATELGMRPLQAHCHRGLGRVLGDATEEARAAGLYADMGMALWLEGTA